MLTFPDEYSYSGKQPDPVFPVNKKHLISDVLAIITEQTRTYTPLNEEQTFHLPPIMV